MQIAAPQHATESVLAALVGDDCHWCATDTLARDEFRDNDAVVCEDCETAAVRVW